MARETIKKTIKGREYEFSQYGAKQGLKMLLRLGKIIGQPLALSLGALGDKKEEDSTSILDRNINGDLLGQAIKALMSNAGEDEVLDLCMELSSRNVLCDGKQIDFNSHYEGNFGLMFKVIAAALEVQYGNFFDALLDLQAGDDTPFSPISNQDPRT